MTLPASFPLSMSQIANELGLPLPLWLTHGWVVALAGKSSAPVSFSDLLGKTGRFDGAVFCQSAGPVGVALLTFPNSPWFGGILANFFSNKSPQLSGIGFSSAPNWGGNILFKNDSTGVSVVLTKTDSVSWNIPSPVPANLCRVGSTDTFTILPSS